VGKFTAYKLPLKNLSAGIHEYEYKLTGQFFKDMESTDVRDAEVGVHLTVVYRDDVYYLDFKFIGDVVLLCDRCLDDLHFPIDTDYHIKVKYGDEYRDDSDDVLEIPESDSELNVAYMMYDTVSLAIPIKHVHQPGKCNRAMSALLRKHRTIVPDDEDSAFEDQLIDEMDVMTDDAANTSVSIDPRWEKLRNLADNQLIDN